MEQSGNTQETLREHSGNIARERTQMTMRISPFGQLGLQASSQGCEMSKHKIILRDDEIKHVWTIWDVGVLSEAQDV